MRDTIKAHVALILVNLIYGANYVIAKEVMPTYIKPFGFIFIRASTGLLLFWLFHWLLTTLTKNDHLNKKVAREDWIKLALCGLFGVAINQMMFFKGLSLTSPINASLIMITSPIMVLIMASIMIRERITSIKLLGILLGTLGAGMIIWISNSDNNTNSSMLGDLFIFINASSYGLYLVLVKPLMNNYHPFTVIKWVFLFGFLYVIPFGWHEFAMIEWHTFPQQIWMAVIYVIIATTFMTYLFNIYALEKVNASVVSAYIYTQPVIATTIAMLLGKDHLSLIKLGAAILIFAGVFLVSRK